MTEAAGTAIHASAVEIGGLGLLITGRSGSGKSTLALELLALGATLISDDQTLVQPGTPPLLSPPPSIAGMIEIRGVGLVELSHAAGVPVGLIVDLDTREENRLPRRRTRDLLGHQVEVIFARDLHALAAIVCAVVKGKRHDPDQDQLPKS
ncbi:serine kinase [Rhodobacteraceae bacterium NNCM2]|nr:serine kinase [Coraliihabitans acroporae]